ncbi:hypothetical protein STENM223S_09693 [Streptomyces tendae]
MGFQPDSARNGPGERFALAGDLSLALSTLRDPCRAYASIRFADLSRWKLRASSRETCIWETPSSALI